MGLAAMEDQEEDRDRLGSILLGPQEPVVRMNAGGRPTEFMVDTGAEHSVVTQPVGPLSQRQAPPVGSMDKRTHHPFLLPR